ncbi:MAG TPA: glucoamylase family protein [Phototrophicaceae bacterium]|nr:glucoamylase family protein [Phototrophicaceae bacterium]
MTQNLSSPNITEVSELNHPGDEILKENPLELLASRLAKQYQLAPQPASKPLLLELLEQQEAVLTEAYHYFSQTAEDDLLLSYAAEWLLDNYFVVQQTIRQIREDLPIGYYRQLPKLSNTLWASYPRVYALAGEVLDYNHFQFDSEQVIHFLQAFQVDTPLTMGEVWAFPTMLRLSIVSSLAQTLVSLLPKTVPSTLTPAASPDESLVGVYITSLRRLAIQNWKNFFESVSTVEQILRLDPAEIYAVMDFDTRNHYREVIEQVARLTKQKEEDIARQAITLSKAAPAAARQHHVGYYLIGAGRRQLEDQFQYQPALADAGRRWLLAHPTATYLVSIILPTLLLTFLLADYVAAAGGTWPQVLGVWALTLIPATAIVSSIVNWVVTNSIAPRLLPRLDFQSGLPAECRTMVVIPTLLTHVEEIDSLLQQLELHFLRNADPFLSFALLTDFGDASSQHLPDDAALISRTQAGIAALNVTYPRESPPFYLFHRERQWNPAQGSWMGWERKRGKLMEFNHLLRGDTTTSYTVQVGDLSILPQIKYVITLDADTILPEGSARRLVATLAHPLNRAEYDPSSGKVVTGYTVLQPRVEVKPASANQSRFTRIFAGDVGLDLYTHAVSDVYQDLFGEGSYVGKGIYDVDNFELCLANRIPENTLLSHDLFEGIFVRVALVTDILLLEEYPPRYLSHTRRLHRWIRGDWQLLPWLFPRIPTDQIGKTVPNTLSLLDRWKILDNLRRSLVSPALLTLLIMAWLGLIASPLVWTIFTLAALGLPLFLSLFTGLRRPATESVREVLRSRQMDALRWGLALVFLPYEALLSLNAIAVTLLRLLITRQRLLQWTTAAQTARLFTVETGPESTWREMILMPILTSIVGLMVVIVNPAALPLALPFLLLWLASPQIAYWISRPNAPTEAVLSEEQNARLQHLARQTWLFFEQTVGPEDHWLPPDHFQETPRMVAHRTSPTNIGLLLTATLAAYDLGYTGQLDLFTRLQATFETLDQLEHYRGHLLNWYDTQTLAPLLPRYISTVDSGNLAGCLIVIKQACLAFPDSYAMRPQRWQGLLDTLSLLETSLNNLYRNSQEVAVAHLQTYLATLRQTIQVILQVPDQWAALILWLNHEAWETLSNLIIDVLELESVALNPEILHSLRITSERFHHHLMNMQRDMDLLLPWLLPLNQPPALLSQPDVEPPLAAAWAKLVEILPQSPRLREIETFCDTVATELDHIEARLAVGTGSAAQVQEAQAWSQHLRDRLDTTRGQVRALLTGYQSLAEQAENHFQAMDFNFLFHPQRQVFHIGYNVTTDRLDDNYYDLLASEARLASFLAIAKRDVPHSHWLYLGRPITQANNALTLLSWSGTMFEYLMPTLFMKSYEHTFLTQSCRAVVDYQINYGHEKKMAWGISESSYYAFDSSMTYQYRAFGVPGLGFKRGLTEDLVISPYASLLALRLRPQAVCQNIDHLDELNMRGLYGFYEAVDYTPSRLALREDYARVQSYMAHHQGMILVSLTNHLLHDPMLQRFHADPRVQSFALLLQEKIPTQAPIEHPHPDEALAHPLASVQTSINPWSVPNETAGPQVHVLSNGRYSTVITQAGSGYSQWEGLALTRWEADTTLDAWGSWLYLYDQDSGHVWSAGYQPTAVTPEFQQVLFYPHQAEFQRRDRDITLIMQVTVAAEDDVEIRHLTLINHGDQVRHLRLTSYGEVVLAPPPERHPAFNKLFIESEYLHDHNLLLFRRRPRSGDEKPVYLGQLLITSPGTELTRAYEGDRLRFLGRGQTSRTPAVGQMDFDLSKTVGVTLDPIMALGQEITLEPYGRTEVAYLTLAAASRNEILRLAERYKTFPALNHAVEMTRRQQELAWRQLDWGTPELSLIPPLLSLLLYPNPGLRAAADILNANTKGQSGLWAYGISGDMPILLVRIGSVDNLPLVLELLRAHTYWYNQQVRVDLVILNLTDSNYAQELHGQLHRLIARSNSMNRLNQRGGIFVLNADQMGETDRTLLQTTARVILDGDRGSIADQLPALAARWASLPVFTPASFNLETPTTTPPLARPTNLQFDNGWGGFSADGKEYVIYLEAGQWTPAPWVNVIANEHFGFLVSEAGAGYTWAENSSENRLTPWHNDPVSDAPGEALYLRDEETAQVWSPMPLPSRDTEPYLVQHGAGYSRFQHHSQGVKQTTLLFAATAAPVKIIKLRLENTWDRPRRLTATYYAEWVLGVNRSATQPYILSEYDHTSGALLARNAYHPEFGERVAFLAANKVPHGLTADRNEFLGRLGDRRRPAALNRVGLASRVEAGIDPCAALQLHLDLPPGGSEDIFFLLGEGENHEQALQLIQTYQDSAQVEATWQAVNHFWDQILGTVNVQTPDAAMNILLNRWLLYQALSCRIWGRSGFYQSSGAFGYRDQLQDVMALVSAAPTITRDHILQAARHQFEAGDVLHWWHPPFGRGVRTRFSDDLLWLPFVVAHYLEATGDETILEEKIPFLRGEPLKLEEAERYGQYETTLETDTLYEHCLRAIKRGSTAGAHGLPLMGGGDWNDGMNRVGIGGRGESVWVGWFLYSVLTQFVPLCERRGDPDRAQVYRQQAEQLKISLEAEAWDGRWYRRAYYDDGTPLGAAQNRECQIDAIAQSWAVLSGGGDAQHSVQALAATAEQLVRPEDQLLLLFTPPFDKTPRDPGYIKGYPPGIRENGGQYTHAAIWTVWAFAQQGDGNRAGELFGLLNPILHSQTPEQAQQYRVEPYVIAADVYSVAPHVGRGGWTWYTGSASWMYRLGLEAILGLKRQGNRLSIQPCIPDTWASYELTYRDGDTLYQIQIRNPDGVNRGVIQIKLDGQPVSDDHIPLVKDGGHHEVQVTLGKK